MSHYLGGERTGWGTAQIFHFGDFTLDQSRYRLQRGERILRLERRPMELLLLLVEKRGELVTREEVAGRLWGATVFVDIDQSINTAVRKVRLALHDNSDKPRFIETVVGKGYRFAAPVTENGANSKPRPLDEPEVAHPSENQRSTTVIRPQRSGPFARKMRWVLVGLLALAIGTAGSLLKRSRGDRNTGPPPIRSIAVLPLQNLSGDPAQQYLADGITEELIGRLAGIHALRVISRTTVMSLKEDRMSAPEIAKALRVDALVEGSVMRDGDRLRVHAQLSRASTDEHFWSETYDREMGDVLSLESDVAVSIATKVEVTVSGQEHSRLVAARHVAPEVYENYQKGQNQLAKSNSQAEIEKSVDYFEEALAKDPTFAPAYVGLANAYDSLSAIFVGGPPNELRPKVIGAAQKALELDPELAEAHVLLADVYQKQWQWAHAEAEYKHALELRPNDPSAYLGYADWLLCQGRTEEALTWARHARELDPIGVRGVSEGWILFHARRFNEAIRQLRSVLAVYPDDASARWFLGFALIGNGQSEEAIPILERAASIMHRSPGSLELLATANALLGTAPRHFACLMK